VRLGSEPGGLALLKLGVDDDGEAVPLVAALPSVPELTTLFDANARRASVRFAYRGRDRTVDPYGLLTRDGFWYVVGREHEADQRKTYRVDRIEGEVVVGEPDAFAVPPGFDASAAVEDDPKQIGDGEPATALVAVGARRAASVVREVGDDAVVERRDDGTTVVRVPCTNLPAFRSWVLGLLDHAEVLGPPDVRAEIVAWLQACAGGAR
jgi:predicted DNA-binding transcriptional regulator YafY